MVRKISAVIPVIALTAVALVGCAPAAGTANSFGCTPVSTSGPIADAVSVSGEFGVDPQIEAPSAMNVTAQERDVLIAGDGPQIVSPSQVVSLSYSLVRTTDGASAPAQPVGPAVVANLAQAVPTLDEQLLCAREGDRILASLPASALDPAVAAQNGLGPNEGYLMAIDVTKVFPDRPQGTEVFNSAWGLPSVVRAPDGRSGVIVPDGEAPTTTTVETLVRGDGAAVTADDAAILNVLGVGWTGKTQFRSSIDSGTPSVSSAGDLPKAVTDALNGATVGSQLLVVIPAAEAASETADTSAPKDTALIYVIDVLGTLPTS